MAELFDNFEVNRDPKWPILTRLVGASLVLHLVLLSLVIYVPAVRDTVNVAALIASTKFVDKDYVATQISDDVQIVDIEKFRYPDGYFALDGQTGNQSVAAANDPFAPKIISQWRANEPDPEASPSPSPDPNASPSASPGASPSASPTASASPSAAIAQNASPSPSPASQEDAQKELEKTAAEINVTLPVESEINKKPLKDLAIKANDLKNQGKLDLTKPFKVVIQATLGDKGKLENFTFIERTGDEVLNELFANMVSALNDSGLLTYLSGISKANPGSTIRISIEQGESEVLALLESEVTTPDDARQLAAGLNGMLAAGGLIRAGKDEAQLMKNTTAKADGKKVLVNFSMPRQTVIEMLKKQVEPG
jgi:hypothetical protein